MKHRWEMGIIIMTTIPRTIHACVPTVWHSNTPDGLRVLVGGSVSWGYGVR